MGSEDVGNFILATSWHDQIGDVLMVEDIAKRFPELPDWVVEKKASERTMLSLMTADNYTVYPSFQFTDTGLVPGFDRVMQKFPDFGNINPDCDWTIASLLCQRMITLNSRSIVEALADGDINDALAEASRLADSWFSRFGCRLGAS